MTKTARIILFLATLFAVSFATARADMAKLLKMMADHTLCCGSLAGDARKHEALPAVVQVAGIPAGLTPPPSPAPAAATAKAKVEPKATGEKKDFERVGFELLAAFNYQAPAYDGVPAPKAETPAKPSDQIPDYVRALDKKKIAVTGFMLPTKFKDGRVTEFLLMKDQSGCCFGAMPRINEWIIVRMGNGGVPPLMDVPLTFIGTLKVGEVFEEGYLSGLYQLDGEKMIEG